MVDITSVTHFGVIDIINNKNYCRNDFTILFSYSAPLL